MIVCADLDGTLGADPQFYRGELSGLRGEGAKVIVLTGNPKGDEVLARLGFVKGKHYDSCAVVPKKHIAEAKVAFMQSIGATHLIDNSRKNIRAARAAGFTGHWHAAPKQKP